MATATNRFNGIVGEGETGEDGFPTEVRILGEEFVHCHPACQVTEDKADRGANCLVLLTYNTRHFFGVKRVRVLTPRNFLERLRGALWEGFR